MKRWASTRHGNSHQRSAEIPEKTLSCIFSVTREERSVRPEAGKEVSSLLERMANGAKKVSCQQLEMNAKIGDEWKVVRCDEGITGFRKMHVGDFNVALIKNMIEMEKGQKSRIGPTPFDEGTNI